MRRKRVASAKSERIEAVVPEAGDRDRGLFVAELKLVNFRNYARAELALDARPVVLVGDNGAGKTNLLEAVSLLGPGSGLRARPLGELGRTSGPGGFAVAARVMSRLGEVEIGTGLARDQEGEGTGRSVRIA
ncbi:MAG: AAA family ATPase, partial [Methyloceanibacter sp.]